MPTHLNAARLWTLVTAALVLAGAVSALQPSVEASFPAVTHQSAAI